MASKPAGAPSVELCISMAGLPTHLAFTGLNPQRSAQITSWYAPFSVPPQPGMPFISATVVEGNQFLPVSGEYWRVETTRCGSRVEFASYLETGWFDFATNYGELVLRPTGNPENYLRVLYAWRCLEAGALLVHSSGIVRNGRGYVFFGRSGSGKTTTTRHSPDAEILSDDLVILKLIDAPEGPSVQVIGVPFRGEMMEAPRSNTWASLHGLFALQKAERHHLTNLPASEAAGRLAATVPFVMPTAADSARVLALCAEIVRRVPVRTLYFRRDPGFWSLIDA